jgi:hypothetical protein
MLNWDEKLDKSGKIIKFNEEEYLDKWWQGLPLHYKQSVFSNYTGDDPITVWKKE